MAAAVASRSQPSPMQPINAVQSSDAGDQSPIFYALDTPNIGAPVARQGQSDFQRRDSIDEGYRKFQRASSDPAGATPIAQSGSSSKLANEPNPFEQSFGAKPGEKPHRRARSQSPKSAKATPILGAGPAAKLPGVVMIASPSPTTTTGVSHFGWNLDSLRSGPLSPAMLSAPTAQSGSFDPSSMRTGLTPQIGSHAWGPDTPGTAAFFASLTNHTPEMASSSRSGSGVATETVNQQDGPNHFEADFASHISIPNAANGRNAAPDQRIFAQQSMPKPMPQQSHQAAYLVPGSSQTLVRRNVEHGVAHALGNARAETSLMNHHNPLYLLSQSVSAHELDDVADDTVIAAAALQNLNNSPIAQYAPATTVPPSQVISNGIEPDAFPSGSKHGSGTRTSTNSNGSPSATALPASNRSRIKRKLDADAKSLRSTPRTKRVKEPFEEIDDDEDLYDDEDEEDDIKQSASGTRGRHRNKRETDEEKRKSFLERNRQAALKCRQRKKAWLQSLQSKVEYLTADNETLQSTVNSLREEVAALRAVLIAHKDCPVQMPGGGPKSTVGAILAQPNLPKYG